MSKESWLSMQMFFNDTLFHMYGKQHSSVSVIMKAALVHLLLLMFL